MTTFTESQINALNTLIAVAQRAQSRGVLGLEEAAAALAAIRVFVPAEEVTESDESETEDNTSENE